MRKFKIMRKFYINNREVETVEKFLSEFTKVYSLIQTTLPNF